MDTINVKRYSVRVFSVYQHNDPVSRVVFSIDRSTAQEIIRLSQLVRTEKLLEVRKEDERATYYETEAGKYADLYGADKVLTEHGSLSVRESTFLFYASLWSSGVEVCSEQQSIAELAAHFSLDAGLIPSPDLPLLSAVG